MPIRAPWTGGYGFGPRPGQQKPGGRRRPGAGKKVPGGMPNQGLPGNLQNFLPMTPEYIGAQRGAEDQLANSLAGLAYQRAQIPGAINMFGARQGTDIGYEKDALMENMAGRGVVDSTIPGYTSMRDITIPHERNQQDFQLGIQDQLNQLSMGEGQAKLGYNQTLMEALLNRGDEVAQTMPLGLPGQYPGATPRRNRPGRRPRRGRR